MRVLERYTGGASLFKYGHRAATATSASFGGGADSTGVPSCPLFSSSPLTTDSQRLLRSPRKPQRKVPKNPYKVLDAPELQDDFYLNLVDWSSQNVLAVGLGPCVYLWSACTSKV